jgi:SOS-response transcriptional repressor LexA
MEGLELASVSSVAEHVDNLVAKGVIKKVPNTARSLQILDYRQDETVALFKARMPEVLEEDKQILKRAAEILDIDID